MKTILFCMAALAFTAGANCQEATQREVFEQKYENIFGEQPSATVWTLGKNGLHGPECGGGCGGGGGGGCSSGSSDGCCVIL